MVKETITYQDWDGNQRTEDFYFNLTKAELMYMEAEEEGGLASKLERITSSNDGREIIKFVRYLISKSYGRKSADGRRFEKSDEISAEFESTAAYDKFIEQLCLADKADEAISRFMNGIMPRGYGIPEGDVMKWASARVQIPSQSVTSTHT